MVPTITRLRVLVVDDNDDAAMTMALLLKHCGHEAAVAENGEIALQHAPAFRPDAMFIDLAMPKVDGLTVARQLRQQPEFAETPLVAVSGYVDADHRTQATAAGFTDYLPKPYALTTLQATLDRIAARLEASREKVGVSQAIAEQSQERDRELREGLADYWRNRHWHQTVAVSVEKSGISNILTVSERPAADE